MSVLLPMGMAGQKWQSSISKVYIPNPTYLPRYTGNGNDSGDKVTIKASQSQVSPNNARHLGTDGDSGTATAHRQANGTYLFSVNHKAAYITFAPYYSKEKLDNSVSITNIRVTANEILQELIPLTIMAYRHQLFIILLKA